MSCGIGCSGMLNISLSDVSHMCKVNIASFCNAYALE